MVASFGVLMKIGLKHNALLTVGPEHSVPRLNGNFSTFADMPPVFATAMLVAFVEQTCAEAVQPYLSDGQKTVGIHVNLSHSTATPIGMDVMAEIELFGIEGKKLIFKAVCRDEVDVIGEGTHERYIIDEERFMAGLAQKAARK
jgi:fluoroacetyl-CoA thioesterase